MKQINWLISRYLLTTIIPYFAFSWLLLSVILFVQQASRYADIFFSVNIPANLVWQLTIALIPNVVASTCPMAMLVGTIIGLSKMQGDSELIAIRASGVGNFQITAPIMLLGVFLSAFAFFVNLKGVPLAATLVRSVALQTAIKKLESPLEPGVFNSEIAGYTIYVKDGDFETGRWKNLFIYTEDRGAGTVRLITSQNGRIDTSDQLSELVLENAVSSTLPIAAGQGKYVSENIGEVRFAIRTRRSDLIEKLSSPDLSPNELGLQELFDYAAASDGPERVEAQLLWQRRILLSITPLIFCLLGTVIVLRFNRGGRGFGILLALITLIGFYLLAFLGEQLARVGMIGVLAGGLIPIAGSLAAIVWLGYTRRIDVWTGWSHNAGAWIGVLKTAPKRFYSMGIFGGLTAGLRDFDIVRDLLKYFLLTLCFLSAIFLIFTAFELWKFAGTSDGGIVILGRYLFYLLPFIYLQIAPSAAMIATLATYVIKSRQNEIVTWTSAGQSVYRLLLPCFVMMLLVGGVNWVVQEKLLPRANQLQDETRNLIRSRGVPANPGGKYWIANEKRIYSFELSAGTEDTVCLSGCVYNLTIYEFADNGELQFIYRAGRAAWRDGTINFIGDSERSDLNDGKIVTSHISGGNITEPSNPFAELRKKPNHLDSFGIKRQIAAADSEIERQNLTVAVEKKHTTLFLPFVMALFTAPFSLSLSRKGKAATVGFAIGLWLLFVGTNGVFEQLGLNGYLSPSLAVWSPLVFFSLLGIYLLSRVRT